MFLHPFTLVMHYGRTKLILTLYIIKIGIIKSCGTMTLFDLRNLERFEYYEATTETVEAFFFVCFCFGTAKTFYHISLLFSFLISLTL